MGPAKAVTTKPTLLTLPQELQDAIFDYAYPDASASYISRKAWQFREMSRWRKTGRTYTKRPFPPHTINELLVSNEFFLAASKAWAGNQTFKGIRFICDRTSEAEGVAAAYAKKITITEFEVREACDMRNLREVTIEVSDYLFDCLEDVLLSEESMTSSHFQVVLDWHYALKEFGRKLHIPTIHLHSSTRYADPENDPPTQIWLDNVKRFEVHWSKQLVKLHAHARLRCHRSTSDLKPIYHGSAVRRDTHELGRDYMERGWLKQKDEVMEAASKSEAGERHDASSSTMPSSVACVRGELADSMVPETAAELRERRSTGAKILRTGSVVPKGGFSRCWSSF